MALIIIRASPSASPTPGYWTIRVLGTSNRTRKTHARARTRTPPPHTHTHKHTDAVYFLKSMWNYTVVNKTCNPNFSVTVDLPDKSWERCPPSINFAGNFAFSFLLQKINRCGEIQDCKVNSLSLFYPYTFHIVLRGAGCIIRLKNRFFFKLILIYLANMFPK